MATLFEKMKTSSLMGRAYPGILANALQTDNEAIFRTVHASLHNPDYTIREFGMPNDSTFSSEKGILYAAITSGADKIALSLAKNPAITVSESGYYSARTTRNGHVTRSRTDYPAPLEAAEQRGMTEVASVIADRLSQVAANRTIKMRAQQLTV